MTFAYYEFVVIGWKILFYFLIAFVLLLGLLIYQNEQKIEKLECRVRSLEAEFEEEEE